MIFIIQNTMMVEIIDETGKEYKLMDGQDIDISGIRYSLRGDTIFAEVV